MRAIILGQFHNPKYDAVSRLRYAVEDNSWDVRDAMATLRVINLSIHEPFQITNIQLKVARNSRPDDRPKLFRVARQHNIRIQISDRLDGDHDLRFSRMARLVHKNVRKMSTRHSDAMSKRRRDAGRNDDAIPS